MVSVLVGHGRAARSVSSMAAPAAEVVPGRIRYSIFLWGGYLERALSFRTGGHAWLLTA